MLILNAMYPVVFGQAPIKKLCEDLEQTAANELKPAVSRPEIDVAERHWSAKKKFAVVISAYKSADSKSDLPFAEVDGSLIARKLCAIGYTILGVLTNETVTRNNIRLTLQKAQTITRQRNGRLLVYYSGHGVVAEDGSDLYLQVYDEPPGDKAGISIPDLIGFAYPPNAKGQLSLIIDSCFSGKGTFSGTLTAAKLKNINIISSGSGDQQPSYSITLSRDPSGKEKTASAFSYYLSQAITNETWNKVDRDSDGIITFGELRLYLATKLKCDFIHEPKKIQGLMEPDGFPRDSNEFFAFDPDRERNFNTPVIIDLTIKEIEIQSALETQWPAPQESGPSITPTSCDSTFSSPQAFVPSLSHSSKSGNLSDWISNETNLGVRERRSFNQDLFPWSAFLGSASIQDPLARLASYTDFTTQTASLQSSMQSQTLNPPQPASTKTISAKLAAQLRGQDGNYYTSGLKALAERRFDEARNLLQRSLAQKKVDRVRVYRSLGRNEVLAGNYEAAEKWYKRALRLSADERDPATLNEMGNALRLGGDYDDAETLISRAISEIKDVSVDFKKDNLYLTSIVNLAQLYFDKASYKNSELLYKQAIDILRPQMDLGPPRIRDMRSPTSASEGIAAGISVAWLNRDLAGVYYSEGEYDEALRCAEQVEMIVFLLLRGQLGGAPPPPTEMLARIIGQYIGITVPIQNIQAAIHIERGEFSQAEGPLELALRHVRMVFSDDDPRTTGTLLNLAILRTKQGRIDDAKQIFAHVIAIQEKNLGPKHPDLALTLEQYSTLLNKANQKDEAAKIKAWARKIENANRSHKSGRTEFFWSRYSNPVEYAR